MIPILKTSTVFYNKTNVFYNKTNKGKVRPVSNAKVAIITPSKYNRNVDKSKRILDLFEIDYTNITNSENSNTNLYNSIIFAKNDGYSGILCYDNDLDLVNDIAKNTVLPVVYVGPEKEYNNSFSTMCNPVAIFDDNCAINATIFLIQILSIKFKKIKKKLEDMQNSI